MSLLIMVYLQQRHAVKPLSGLYPLTCCLLLQYLMQSCAHGGIRDISALAQGAGLQKSRWPKRIKRFPNRFHKVEKKFCCKVPEITLNVLPHTLRRSLKCSRFRRLALRRSLKSLSSGALALRIAVTLNAVTLNAHLHRRERTHAITARVQLGVALHSVLAMLATTIAGVVMCVLKHLAFRYVCIETVGLKLDS
jgi:hypothetical protein